MEKKDDLRWLGVWIRLERLRRNWSQEGLCKGLCAVSYLSKIEQGKVPSPNPDLLRLLCQRLDGAWQDDPAVLAPLRQRVEDFYEAFLDDDFCGVNRNYQAIIDQWETCCHSPLLLDALIIGYQDENDDIRLSEAEQTVLREVEPVLSHRQKTVYKLSVGRGLELLEENPSSRDYLGVGVQYYEKGSYTRAVELLQTAYQMAAQEGRVNLMLSARTFSGNCYANLLDYTQMAAHYQVAEKIALALGAGEKLKDIRYNAASTALELGRTEEAYRYFHRVCGEKAPPEKVTIMGLHKLALCCEKLGYREEALSALDRAKKANVTFPDRETALSICELVRYRLTHPDYLHDPLYGEMLTGCFEQMVAELPMGYAGLHVPYLLEWYTENRMYKDAYQLLLRFPSTPWKPPV